MQSDLVFRVEAKGLEPSNLLTASQALYQLSYAPAGGVRLSADSGIQTESAEPPTGSDQGRRGVGA